MKPKIWKEWKKNGYHSYIIKLNSVKTYVVNELMNLRWVIISNKQYQQEFKTKEQAMLKAQSLIIKEFKKIEKVMRDKA